MSEVNSDNSHLHFSKFDQFSNIMENWRHQVPPTQREELIQKLTHHLCSLRPYVEVGPTRQKIQQLEMFWFQTSPSESGYMQNLSTLLTLIQSLITSDQVHWEFRDHGTQKWTAFPHEIHEALEHAASALSVSPTATTSRGTEFMWKDALTRVRFLGNTVTLLPDGASVVFLDQTRASTASSSSSREYELRCRLTCRRNTDDGKVITRSTTEYKATSVVSSEPQLFWTTTSTGVVPDHWTTTRGFHDTLLALTSPEYIQVRSMLTQTSCADPNVTSDNQMCIRRIENHFLWKMYTALCDARETEEGPEHATQLALWHGTTREASIDIASRGFNRSFATSHSHVAQFGQGTYFATKSGYSLDRSYSCAADDRTRTLVLAFVCVGKSTVGSPVYKNAPMGFNSCVDNVMCPGVYTTFEDFTAYPAYIVTLKEEEAGGGFNHRGSLETPRQDSVFTI